MSYPFTPSELVYPKIANRTKKSISLREQGKEIWLPPNPLAVRPRLAAWPKWKSKIRPPLQSPQIPDRKIFSICWKPIRPTLISTKATAVGRVKTKYKKH